MPTPMMGYLCLINMHDVYTMPNTASFIPLMNCWNKNKNCFDYMCQSIQRIQ